MAIAASRATLQAASDGRSVQSYIDETPQWGDGTSVRSTPMTGMQWLIWTLAAAGKFFEGFVVFMTGVALPLISRQIRDRFSPERPDQRGQPGRHSGRRHRPRRNVGCVRPQAHVHHRDDHLLRLPGGAGVLHRIRLADRLFLFGLGVALGCDYPTAHMIISESIPSTSRGKLVLARVRVPGHGRAWRHRRRLFRSGRLPDLDAWRWMYAGAIIPP